MIVVSLIIVVVPGPGSPGLLKQLLSGSKQSHMGSSGYIAQKLSRSTNTGADGGAEAAGVGAVTGCGVDAGGVTAGTGVGGGTDTGTVIGGANTGGGGTGTGVGTGVGTGGVGVATGGRPGVITPMPGADQLPNGSAVQTTPS